MGKESDGSNKGCRDESIEAKRNVGRLNVVELDRKPGQKETQNQSEYGKNDATGKAENSSCRPKVLPFDNTPNTRHNSVGNPVVGRGVFKSNHKRNQHTD